MAMMMQYNERKLDLEYVVYKTCDDENMNFIIRPSEVSGIQLCSLYAWWYVYPPVFYLGG